MTQAQLMILATCGLAAITQGWCQASMAGANIQWPHDLGLNITRFQDEPTTSSVLKFSWLMAAPFISGALVAFFITDPLVNEGKIGRKWAIVITGIFTLVSVVAAAFTHSWKSFMAWRILLGVGMGTKASIVPIYISEISPEKIRGMLAMSWQLFDTLGILLGNCANLAVYRFSRTHPSWRFMIALPFISSLMFLILAIFCVESPRWLLKAGKVPQALQALIRLHDLPSPIVACGELYLLFRQLEEEEKVYMTQLVSKEKKSRFSGFLLARRSTDSTSEEQKLLRTSLWDRICLLLLVPRMQNAVKASICVMAAQQACGINILAFMSTTMYGEIRKHSETSLTDVQQKEQSLEFSVYFGLTNFLCTWIAFPLIDWKSRRFLLNLAFPFMATFMFIIGGSLNTQDPNTRTNLFIAFTLLFTSAFSIEGPTAFVISAEVHALIVRELGMSFAVFTNFFLAGVLSFLIPIMASSMNNWWFWVLFGGLNLIFWHLSRVYVKPTEDLTLEGISREYGTDTKEMYVQLEEVRFVAYIGRKLRRK